MYVHDQSRLSYEKHILWNSAEFILFYFIKQSQHHQERYKAVNINFQTDDCEYTKADVFNLKMSVLHCHSSDESSTFSTHTHKIKKIPHKSSVKRKNASPENLHVVKSFKTSRSTFKSVCRK